MSNLTTTISVLLELAETVLFRPVANSDSEEILSYIQVSEPSGLEVMIFGELKASITAEDEVPTLTLFCTLASEILVVSIFLAGINASGAGFVLQPVIIKTIIIKKAFLYITVVVMKRNCLRLNLLISL